MEGLEVATILPMPKIMTNGILLMIAQYLKCQPRESKAQVHIFCFIREKQMSDEYIKLFNYF